MLLNAIAALCLAAMMFVPIVNVVVGAVVGAAIAGWIGIAAGTLLAVATCIAEVVLIRWRRERHARSGTAAADDLKAEIAAVPHAGLAPAPVATRPTIRTLPPSNRRPPPQEVRERARAGRPAVRAA